MGITIDFTTTPPSATGSIDGETSHIITDKEINAFSLNNTDKIKKEIEAIMGAAPKYVWYKNPTTPCDRPAMYTDFNWPQVKANLVFKSARFLSDERRILASVPMEYENNLNHSVEYTANISKSETESITHSQSDTDVFGVSVTIEMTIASSFKIGGTVSYSHQWNNTETQQHSVTIESGAGAKFTLEPGEKAVAQLTYEEVVSKVELLYDAYLTGYAAVEYGYWYKDHRKYGIPQVIHNKRRELKEIVTIKGFDKYKVKVSRLQSNDEPLEFIINPNIIAAPDAPEEKT